ncbi:transmembrane protein 116-like isoform X2 [Dysidea avara]|uniref:transmembrane protein 116-like isoform X2 n=1 Tax=Dysidea avara TaxID=196820 RepID=UPI003321B843
MRYRGFPNPIAPVMSCLVNISVNDSTYLEERCDLGNEFYVWYDSIAGVRVITSSLSVLGAASIVWVSLISRRLRSPEVHPIFMISLADMFLSLLYIVGSTLWLFDEPTKSSSDFSYINASSISVNGVCLYLSLFSTWMHLASTNLTVLYAIFAFLGLRRMVLHAQGVRYWDCTKWITVISYVIAWFQPVVVSVPVFLATVTSKGLVSDADECGCWCKPAAINVLPVMWLQNTTISSPYVENLFHYATGMYWILIVNFSVSLLLLLLFYGLVMWYLKKLKKCGDFVLACDTVRFLHEETRYIGASIDHTKHREFTILLLLQSLTVSLQGFLNALVYGWTRQDFVVELSLRHTYNLSESTTSRGGGYQPLPEHDGNQHFAQFSQVVGSSSFNKTI